MRLRKCSDISMVFPEYYEVVSEDNTVLLDIHLNEEGMTKVSINNSTIDINVMLKLLNDAYTKLNAEK